MVVLWNRTHVPVVIMGMTGIPVGVHQDRLIATAPGYQAPLLDRIDIHIEVPALKVEEITGEIKNSAENSATMRERVMAAHERQVERYSEEHFNFNSQLKGKKLKKYCLLDDESVFLMKDAIDRLGLSARAYDRILRLSRTIADMEGSEYIKSHHVAEAIQYRSLDRKVY